MYMKIKWNNPYGNEITKSWGDLGGGMFVFNCII
jgi:hypothetical protein